MHQDSDRLIRREVERVIEIVGAGGKIRDADGELIERTRVRFCWIACGDHGLSAGAAGDQQ